MASNDPAPPSTRHLGRGPGPKTRHILSHWLDPESADLLAGSLTAAGITVHCDTSVSAATSVWPNAGLPIGTGIPGDALGRSLGEERISAIGDCAETLGAHSRPSAPAALDAARHAVAAMTADVSPAAGGVWPSAAPVTRTPIPLRLRTYDIPGADVAVLGRPHSEPSIQFTTPAPRIPAALLTSPPPTPRRRFSHHRFSHRGPATVRPVSARRNKPDADGKRRRANLFS